MKSPTQPPPVAGACYFHLLWEHEIVALRPILKAMEQQREDVLAQWHRLYLLHLGDSRSLSESEFHEIYGADLNATTRDLLENNMDRYVADIRRAGESLADRRVPFSEVVVSAHLFEQSAQGAFPSNPPGAPGIYLSFDKLSHCRIIVLADSYYRSRSALAVARVRGLEQEAAKRPLDARRDFHGLVVTSPAMRQLCNRIEAAAVTRGTILIVGESGTGKELVARAIHECGGVTTTPFVALNCAALPRELIESELFGYKRGAFSGAADDYLGLFRAAEGGTLFLDEITEMSPETQSKLLRALQERHVRPVGSTREVPVNVRLIASTNRDPEEAVRVGALRQDLYYRLQVNVLRVPPLRERPEAIPALLDHFIALFNEKFRRLLPVAGVAKDAMEALSRYEWPGNIRELSNAIEAAFTFGRSTMIQLADLPVQVQGRAVGTPVPVPAPAGNLPTFAEVERNLIRRALDNTGGNKVRAAELLQISRKKLCSKITKYDLA